MNTTCPKCGTAYNITEAHVGRKFRCKNCQSALQVTAAGIEYQSAPAATAGPAGGAFNFGGREDEDDRGRRPARTRRRDDDEDEEDDRPVRYSRSYRGSGGGLGDYLAFRKMIVPIVIQVIFWLFTGLVLLAGIGFFVLNMVNKQGNVLLGAGVLVIGVPLYIFLVRIYCELLIVIFRINDTLTDIKNVLERRER
jgi:predicted Zn finger-like uncharacterized protein